MSTLKTPLRYDYRTPKNNEQLAQYLGISHTKLEKLTSSEKNNFFVWHQIPKRRGFPFAVRTVCEAPIPWVADIYKTFTRRFDLFCRNLEPRHPHRYSYGYTKGRGTYDNALPHCGAPLVLHADIQDFFTSIKHEDVKKLFQSLQINTTVAQTLADLVTIDGKLPQGLHSSPLISNLICLDLDDQMNELAQSFKAKYTRYADDITISGYAVPTKEEVGEILNNHGFSLSERKFRITKPGQAHFVTGLSVTDTQPHVPKKMKRRLRQEIYYCEKFGVENHLVREKIDARVQQGINRIDGTIRYVSHIERHLASRLRSKWHELMERDWVTPSYIPIEKQVTPLIVWHLDETEIEFNGKKFLAICLTQTQTPHEIAVSTQTLLEDYIINPYTMGNKDALKKNGLHFTDSDEDLRKAYLEKLEMFDLRAYIAFSELISDTQYQKTYLHLLQHLIRNRLRSCDRAGVFFTYEQNSKIKKVDLEQTVQAIYADLEQKNDRRPVNLRIKVGNKSDPLFSLPDYILGVFAKYAKANDLSQKQTTDREKAFFEKIRDKCRIILDVDQNIVYSRKRPFQSW